MKIKTAKDIKISKFQKVVSKLVEERAYKKNIRLFNKALKSNVKENVYYVSKNQLQWSSLLFANWIDTAYVEGFKRACNDISEVHERTYNGLIGGWKIKKEGE